MTFTAGWQKLFHASPKIGFLSAARKLSGGPGGRDAVPAEKIEATGRVIFNMRLDAVVAGAFLLLVGAILATSPWRWLNLIPGRSAKDLRESPPVWLEAEAGGPGARFRRVRMAVGAGPAVRGGVAAPGGGETHGQAGPDRARGVRAWGRIDAGGRRRALAEGADGEGRPELQPVSAGKAWAEKEELRFRRPRCC